jgi:transcriptional regulator with XRE-family HTH domain
MQKELAEYVGVQANTISDWLRLGTSPKVKHIVKIARYFNVSYDYLFTGKDSIAELKPDHYTLTENEMELVDAFRQLPNENAQLRFLGIANDRMAELMSRYATEKNVV